MYLSIASYKLVTILYLTNLIKSYYHMNSIGLLAAHTLPTKNDLLFFDSFISMGGDYLRSSDRVSPSLSGFSWNKHHVEHIDSDMEYLKSQNILTNDKKDIKDLLKEAANLNIPVKDVSESLNRYKAAINREPHFTGGRIPPMDSVVPVYYKKQSRDGYDKYMTSVKARLMALMQNSPSNIFSPLGANIEDLNLSEGKSHSLIQVVLNKLPTPSESTSIEEIISFKKDERVTSSIHELRRWMRISLQNENISPELHKEEIKDLLSDYREHMRMAKLEYTLSRQRILTKLPLATLENILKLNWSKLLDPWFDIREAQFKLLKAEVSPTTPGREVAYFELSKAAFPECENV
jgi:hypothetical protein